MQWPTAVSAAFGAANAPVTKGLAAPLANHAARTTFAGVSSFKHTHKILPAVGAGATVLVAPIAAAAPVAVAAAVAAAPFVLGAAAVGGAAYGIYKLFKS